MSGHWTIKFAVDRNKSFQTLVFVLMPTHLRFGQWNSLPLSAKFDCPVTRQGVSLLATAHACETGVLSHTKDIPLWSLSFAQHLPAWNSCRIRAMCLLFPLSLKIPFTSTPIGTKNNNEWIDLLIGNLKAKKILPENSENNGLKQVLNLFHCWTTYRRYR